MRPVQKSKSGDRHHVACVRAPAELPGAHALSHVAVGDGFRLWK